LADKTTEQYNAAVKVCRDIFSAKTRDYGTSWRIMRLPSITDQIFIKAQRIRTIDLKGEKMVNEEMDVEFIGIANYGVMGLIQMELGDKEGTEISYDEALRLFDKKIKEAYDIMLAKNHDYGEAWRDMRISSFTDLILMRILRIRQIEDNKGKTIMSEGIDSNLHDIINYSIFAMIKLSEQK
jgi:hypothetical protein